MDAWLLLDLERNLRLVNIMRSKVLIAIIGMAILSAVAYILFPNSVTSMFNSSDPIVGVSFSSMGELGFVAAVIYTVIFTDLGYIMLAFWFIVGAIVGIMARGSMNGFVAGFYIPVMGYIIYYIILTINGYILFVNITPDMATTFKYIVVPILANGIFAGVGGIIGGKFRPMPAIDLSSDVIHSLEQLLPRKCPSCGAELYSSARFCSNCGAELPPIVFTMGKK